MDSATDWLPTQPTIHLTSAAQVSSLLDPHLQGYRLTNLEFQNVSLESSYLRTWEPPEAPALPSGQDSELLDMRLFSSGDEHQRSHP